MKTIKVKTWLPVFSGFYDTYCGFNEKDALDLLVDWDSVPEKIKVTVKKDGEFVIDGKEFKAGEKVELTKEELMEIVKDWLCMDGVDYEKYENVVAQKVTEKVLDKYLFVVGHKFEKLVSPKYYNYQNDSIDVEIEIDHKELMKMLKPNLDLFAEYLEKEYTSCSGFTSYYPNTVEGWKEETNNFTELEDHYLGAIMQFFYEYDLLPEEFMEYDIYEQVMDEIDLLEFVDLESFKKAFSYLVKYM